MMINSSIYKCIYLRILKLFTDFKVMTDIAIATFLEVELVLLFNLSNISTI